MGPPGGTPRAGRVRHPAVPIALALLCAAGTGRVAALTDEEIFRDFGFDLAGPGARSLGMGGALIVTATDATAAQANPAGLRYVAEKQVYLELRSTSDDPPGFASATGSLAVGPLGERDLPFLGLTSTSEADGVVVPGYLAFAMPFDLGGGRRLSAAISRYVLFSQERTLPSGGGGTEARFAFDTFPNTVNNMGEIEAYSVATPVTGESDTEIVYWNGAAALDVHPDFSIGMTVTFATLDMQAETLTQVIDPQEIFLEPTHPRLPATPTSDLYETRIDDSDTDVSWSLGLHWHPDSVFANGPSPWQFGAAFRRGTDFTVSESTVLNQIPGTTFETTVVVPDAYGLGVSYRPAPAWLVTAEYERVEFSDMLAGFQSGVNFLTSGQLADGAFGVNPAVPITYTVDDGSVLRAGVEYERRIGGPSGWRLALRGGYYRTPDSRIRMSQFNSTDPDVNAVYLEAFSGGEQTDHYTGGVGFAFGRSSFDIGAETSDLGTRIVGSWVATWGGAP